MESQTVYETRRDNAKYLMERAGGPAKFASRIGRSPGQVSHIIGPSPSKNIGDDLARVIEGAFDLPRGWLDQMQVAQPIAAYEVRGVDGDDGVDPEREVLVDEVDVLLSGGNGTPMPEFVETKFRMAYQLYWFKRWNAKPENVKLMRVKGSSMEPLLWDGDRVAVHVADRTVESDRVYAFVTSHEARIKRLFRQPDGGLRIVSDNPDKSRYPDEIVAPAMLGSVYVIGRVIDKSGAGGL